MALPSHHFLKMHNHTAKIPHETLSPVNMHTLVASQRKVLKHLWKSGSDFQKVLVLAIMTHIILCVFNCKNEPFTFTPPQ